MELVEFNARISKSRLVRMKRLGDAIGIDRCEVAKRCLRYWKRVTGGVVIWPMGQNTTENEEPGMPTRWMLPINLVKKRSGELLTAEEILKIIDWRLSTIAEPKPVDKQLQVEVDNYNRQAARYGVPTV